MSMETTNPIKEKLLRELEVKQEALKRLKGGVLERIAWNRKQWEFLNDPRREVMLSGLNQGGKSTALCGEAAYHYTGRYPKGWTGHKFNRPITAAIGGETAQTTRDLLVNRLLGEPGARGSGYIPKDCIGEIVYARGGLQDQVEYFYVKHFDEEGNHDGWSKVYVFSYSKGWERIQGYTLDLISIDEEPPFRVYDEFSARLNQSRGYLRIAMTPLKGQTQLYLLFDESKAQNRGIVHYDIRQATHWTEEHRKELIDKYADHPYANARLRGLPIAAEGIIYGIPDDIIVVDDFTIPQNKHTKSIIGLDFPHTVGSFAAVRLVHDTQNDIVYLVDSYKEKGQSYVVNGHRVAMMGGRVVPVAWPHDGGRISGDGSTVAGQYRDLGLNLLGEPASMIDIAGKKTRSVWGVIEEVYERMQDGRFKVFRSQHEFLREKSLYRHEDGKIVKGEDHLIDAMHKAIMMLRFASDAQSRVVVDDYIGPDGLGSIVGQYNFYTGRKRWPV